MIYYVFLPHSKIHLYLNIENNLLNNGIKSIDRAIYEFKQLCRNVDDKLYSLLYLFYSLIDKDLSLPRVLSNTLPIELLSSFTKFLQLINFKDIPFILFAIYDSIYKYLSPYIEEAITNNFTITFSYQCKNKKCKKDIKVGYILEQILTSSSFFIGSIYNKPLSPFDNEKIIINEHEYITLEFIYSDKSIYTVYVDFWLKYKNNKDIFGDNEYILSILNTRAWFIILVDKVIITNHKTNDKQVFEFYTIDEKIKLLDLIETLLPPEFVTTYNNRELTIDQYIDESIYNNYFSFFPVSIIKGFQTLDYKKLENEIYKNNQSSISYIQCPYCNYDKNIPPFINLADDIYDYISEYMYTKLHSKGLSYTLKLNNLTESNYTDYKQSLNIETSNLKDLEKELDRLIKERNKRIEQEMKKRQRQYQQFNKR